MATWLTISSLFILYAVVRYRLKSLQVEYFAFDNETVTAKDYTLEINLTQKQCENVLSVYDGEEGVSPGLRLKLALMKFIEDALD